MFKKKTAPVMSAPRKRITVTTSDPSKPHEVLDMVRGVSVLASNVLKDTRESLRNLSGGDMQHYSSLVAASFDLARSRMEDAALALEADAVVTVRTQTVSLAEGAAEVICYGTAVRFVKAET